MTPEAKRFWWPGMKQDIENQVKVCTACLASGKNLIYHKPKMYNGKLEHLSGPGQEIQIDFTGKSQNKNLQGEIQIILAVDRFSKWPTVQICKTSEAKKVINFLTSNFYLYGIPEKRTSDKGGAIISKETKQFCRN